MQEGREQRVRWDGAIILERAELDVEASDLAVELERLVRGNCVGSWNDGNKNSLDEF